MIDLEELHPSVQELIVETLGAEKMERIGRFFQRCGRQAGERWVPGVPRKTFERFGERPPYQQSKACTDALVGLLQGPLGHLGRSFSFVTILQLGLCATECLRYIADEILE